MLLGLTIFNSLTFIIYGLFCIFTDHMVEEFTRYRMLHLRLLVGYLELIGGLGCLIGYYFVPFLSIFACLGLALLMTMGAYVRIRVEDPFLLTLPAIILGLLNYYLACRQIMSFIEKRA